MILSGLFFIIWDELFTINNVWSFNSNYVSGLYIRHLPIEEVLFFICVPYACLFIYEVCNAYFKIHWNPTLIQILTWFFIVICVLCSVLFFDRMYTMVNTITCLIVLLVARYCLSSNTLGYFFMAYGISLIPFLLCNGILTSLPIVIYNNAENTGIRIHTIPIEDTIYCLTLLLSPLLIMNFLHKKKTA